MATRPQRHKPTTNTARPPVKSTWRKSSDLYRTPRWRRISAAVRAAHPVCQVEGCQNRSEECDHVNGWTSEADFFSPPFMSVCKKCHNRKTLQTRWNNKGGE